MSDREAFEKRASERGVWPMLTHQEIFDAGWQAALQSQQGEAENYAVVEADLGCLTYEVHAHSELRLGDKLYTHPPAQTAQPQVPDGLAHILSIKNGNIWHTEKSEQIKLPKDFELKLYAIEAMLASQEQERGE